MESDLGLVFLEIKSKLKQSLSKTESITEERSFFNPLFDVKGNSVNNAEFSMPLSLIAFLIMSTAFNAISAWFDETSYK